MSYAQVSTVMESARPAFTTVFRENLGFVWRSLRHMGVRQADLEDQTQEVFIVVHRRHSDWDGLHVRAWLYAIARRVAAAYHRRGYRVHERTVDEMPDVPAAEKTDLAALEAALASLTEEERDVFVLHEIEQLVLREVCDAVGLPMHTVYRRLASAREKVLARMKES